MADLSDYASAERVSVVADVGDDTFGPVRVVLDVVLDGSDMTITLDGIDPHLDPDVVRSELMSAVRHAIYKVTVAARQTVDYQRATQLSAR